MVWQRWVRTLAVLAALGLAAPTLTGCGTDDDDGSTPSQDVIGDVDEDVDQDTDTVDPPDTDVSPDADTDEPDPPLPDPAALRVVHASFDAPEVDVWINGVKSNIQGLAFGETSGAFLQVQPGSYTIAVTAAGADTTDDALFEEELTLESNTRYTAWAYGSFDGSGDNAFGIELMTSAAGAPEAGSVDIHFGHAAINVGPVWVTPEGSTDPLIAGTNLGESAGPITVPAATYALGVALEADGEPALTFNADLSQLSGLVQVFAIGDLESEEGLELLAVLINGTALRLSPESDVVDPPDPIANWRAFHASFDAPEVAVWIDDVLVEDDIAFGEGTGAFDPVEPGTYTVTVTAAGAADTTDSLYEEELTLEDGQFYTIFAYGSFADAEEFGFAIFATDTADITGEIGVAFSHAASGVGEVDITVDGDFPAAFTAVELGASDGPADLDAAEYTFGVSLDGETIALEYVADLSDLSGLVQLFAVGSVESEDGVFVFALLEDGTVVRVDAEEEPVVPGDTFVRVFHGSFDAPAVDVYVDGVLTFPGLEFGASSGAFTQLEEGEYDIAVTVEDEDIADAIFTATLTFDADTKYTVWAHGSLDADTLGFAVATTSIDEVDSGSFGLTFAHAASGVGEVDILSGEDSVFSGVDLGASSGPVTLAAQEYTFGVSLDAGVTTALFFDADLTEAEGQVAVFAVGTTENDENVFLYALFEDGSAARIDRTRFAALRVFHGSFDAPNVDVWANGEVLFSNIAFGETSGAFLEVPEGTYSVAVTVANDALEDAIFTDDLELSFGRHYTVWAYGAVEAEDADDELGFAVIVDDPNAIPSGSIDLTFAHAAPFVGLVDVFGGEALLFNDVAIGESRTTSASPEEITITAVAADGDVQLFFEADLSGVEGFVHVYALFDDSDNIVSIAAILPDGTASIIEPFDVITPQFADIRFVHLGQDAGEVDIWVNGEVLVPGLAFEEATLPFPIRAGAGFVYEVEIRPEGSESTDEPVYSATLEELDANTLYTATAFGNIEGPQGSTFDVDVFGISLPTSEEEEASLRVTFSHFMDFLPPVRVIMMDDPEEELFPTTAFGNTADTSLAFDEDTTLALGVEVGDFGEIIRVFGELEAGQYVHIMASQVDTQMVFYALSEAGELIELDFFLAEMLRVFHGVADAGPVDVLLDGEVLFSGLEYGEVTAFAALAPDDDYQITVVFSDDPTVTLYETTYTTDGDGEFYSIIAIGALNEGPSIDVSVTWEPDYWYQYFGESVAFTAGSFTNGWFEIEFDAGFDIDELFVFTNSVSYGESLNFDTTPDWQALADQEPGGGTEVTFTFFEASEFGDLLGEFRVPVAFLQGDMIRIVTTGVGDDGLLFFIRGDGDVISFPITAPLQFPGN